MLNYCKVKWAENEWKLKKAIENSTDHTRWQYKDLVEMIVRFILNPVKGSEREWSEDIIHEIDDGDYQGTLLYLIHRDDYQPEAYEYLITYVYYGSCCGCDTLQAIQEGSYNDGLPTKEQVKDYMTLCRDMVTHMKCPFAINEEYEEAIMEDEDDVYNPDWT